MTRTIAMIRGSVYLRVRFIDDDGFRTVQTGYSQVGDKSQMRILYKYALWNAAYKHVYDGGSYEWHYEVLSSSFITFSKAKTPKGKTYTKKGRQKVNLTVSQKRNIGKDIKTRNASRKGIEGTSQSRNDIKSMYADDKNDHKQKTRKKIHRRKAHK